MRRFPIFAGVLILSGMARPIFTGENDFTSLMQDALGVGLAP